MTKTQKHAFIALCIIASMVMISTMTGSLLAYIYASYPDTPQTTIQLIMALPSLVAIFASFAAGPLAMKINKKYLLLFASATNLLYFVVFAIFGVTGPFMLLVVVAAISGIARGATMTLMNSAIGEFMGPEKSAVYIAIIGAVLHGGAVIVGILAGMIGAANDGATWNNAFYLGLLIIPTMVVFVKLMPKKVDAAQSSSDNRLNTGLGETPTDSISENRIPSKVYAIVLLVVIICISINAYMLHISYYIIAEHELGTSADVGLINAFFTLIGVIIGLTYSKWEKMLKVWNMPFSYLMPAIGLCVLILASTTIVGAYIAAVFVGFTFCMIIPYNTGYIIKITPPRLIPLSVAIFSGGMNLGMFVAPFVLSNISPLFGGGINGVFLLGIVLALICSIAAIFLFPFSDRNNVKTLS